MNWLDKMQEEAAAARPPVWVISDGTAGMRLQAVALAKALDLPFTELELRPSLSLRLFPSLGRVPGWPVSALRAARPKISDLPPLIITCGRRMAGISFVLRRQGRNLHQGGVRTIHIGDPRLPSHWFDLLVVPAHDPAAQLAQDNPEILVSTGSLHAHNAHSIGQAAMILPRAWAAFKAPYIAVMIGGDNKRYTITAAQMADFAESLKALAKNQRVGLALVPSRRTPKPLLKTLAERLGDIRHLIYDPACDDFNPYPGILSRAKAVVVTSDSVNMTSEACITGLPVLSYFWQPETGRIADFHARMQACGHTIELAKGQPDFKLPARGPVPLDEMEMLAQSVKNRLRLL